MFFVVRRTSVIGVATTVRIMGMGAMDTHDDITISIGRVLWNGRSNDSRLGWSWKIGKGRTTIVRNCVSQNFSSFSGII